MIGISHNDLDEDREWSFPASGVGDSKVRRVYRRLGWSKDAQIEIFNCFCPRPIKGLDKLLDPNTPRCWSSMNSCNMTKKQVSQSGKMGAKGVKDGREVGGFWPCLLIETIMN